MANSDTPKQVALKAIAANAKRLLADARTLQERGSAGSALSLAILAFEESGKGHIVEHGWEKPKNVGSQHSFRHKMAFLVLQASFTQKYGLDVSGVQDKIAKRFAEAGVKPGIKAPLPPITQELREALRAELLPQIQKLTADEQIVLGIEQRWLEKIARAVEGGQLEKIRQSGLYLDIDAALAITSSPEAVQHIEAERWIWAATRVLNLLEHGAYAQAYSPLAELLAAARAGDPEATQALETVKTLSREARNS